MDLETFITSLAAALNDRFDVPILNEEGEAIVLKRIVSVFAGYIPVSLRELMVDASDGLTPQEIEKHKGAAVDVLNRVFNFPILSEEQEASMLRALLDEIFVYAEPNKALPTGSAS